MDAYVIMHNLRLDRVDFSLLLLNFLLDLGQLILQGLYDLLGDALLFFELGLALLAFFAPVFVLFGHAIDVIGYKVYALAERIGALAQYLNGFLHKLDVVLGESALTPAAAATRRLG